MDPIAVTALLYKLNIVKLQCISPVASLIVSREISFSSCDTGNISKTLLRLRYPYIYIFIYLCI